MSINYCCPTRGKPEWLDNFLRETVEKSRLPETLFTVGIDEDEVELYKDCKILKHEQVKTVVLDPRPDSLGEKYNIMQAKYPADWNIMGVDDLALTTIAWDVNLERCGSLYDEDEAGTIMFGRNWQEKVLPAFQAVSQKWIELQGFFMAPYFPFWWHDTWNFEMAQFLGRNLKLGMELRYPSATQGEPPAARRDIQFWAIFFDMTRALRVEKAEEMMLKMKYPKWRSYELRTSWDAMSQAMRANNTPCRDPLWINDYMGGRQEEPMSERHKRLLERATQLLASGGMQMEEKAA